MKNSLDLTILIASTLCFGLVGCGNVVNVTEVEIDASTDTSEDAVFDSVLDVREDGSRHDASVDMLQDTSQDFPDMKDESVDSSPQALFPEFYDDGQLLSLITPYVLNRLNRIRATSSILEDDVFMKIGDSNTVSPSFLHCFEDGPIDLASRPELATTIAFFNTPVQGAGSSYTRQSAATKVGWSASGALAGNPSGIVQEIQTLSPRFALVQFGTNDIERGDVEGYAADMTELIEELIDTGIIPILTSIAPRDDKASSDAQVPQYNAIMRGLAQHHQVPFIDLHAQLLTLPDHGLGADNLHLNASPDGACVFSPEGLKYGQNTRNWLTLQTLQRLRQALLLGAPAPDSATLEIPGDGTSSEPLMIPSLPFTHVADTRVGAQSEFDRYEGCGASQNESGNEVVYELTLNEPTSLNMRVFDQGGVDIDLHVLDASLDTAGCIDRDDKALDLSLSAGTYYIVLDTFVSSSGRVNDGQYMLTVTRTP